MLSLHDGANLPAVPVNVKVFRNPERWSVSDAFNLGISHATGEQIALLCGDLIVLHGWNVYPQLAVRENPRHGFANTYTDGEVPPALKIPGSVFDAASLRSVGAFDPAFGSGRGYEDDDLYWRYVRAGYNPVLLAVLGMQNATQTPTDSHARLYGKEKVHDLAQRNREVFIGKWGMEGTNRESYLMLSVPPLTVNGQRIVPPDIVTTWTTKDYAQVQRTLRLATLQDKEYVL